MSDHWILLYCMHGVWFLRLATLKHTFAMARIASLVTLCSALTGMSRAAALGSAEEYASGAVHAQIMALKVVRISKVTLFVVQY
jgi:hypothetical protein